MTFLRPIQWYHSHADLIWPGFTFHVWTVQLGLKENFMFCMLWRVKKGCLLNMYKYFRRLSRKKILVIDKMNHSKMASFSSKYNETSVGDPDPHEVRLDWLSCIRIRIGNADPDEQINLVSCLSERLFVPSQVPYFFDLSSSFSILFM